MTYSTAPYGPHQTRSQVIFNGRGDMKFFYDLLARRPALSTETFKTTGASVSYWVTGAALL